MIAKHELDWQLLILDIDLERRFRCHEDLSKAVAASAGICFDNFFCFVHTKPLDLALTFQQDDRARQIL
jgi:hypothetical protein